jgi:hypothetical protein
LPPNVHADVMSGTTAQPRRVAIVSQATGVDGVPWEWLNDGPTAIAATPSVRFIRLVPCRYALPPLTVSEPLRVLTVTTNPKDERLLNPYVERDVISDYMRRDTQHYELRELMEPGVDALVEALRWSPHILHYVGHSGVTQQSGAIILHDESGGTRWVTATELSRLLPSSVKLVCLSTCVTAENYDVAGLARIAHVPSDLSLPTTIVNQYAVEPATASRFWSAFYQSLVAHSGNLVEACHEGRMAAFQHPAISWSWASYSLIVRDGTGQPLRLGRASGHSKELFAAEIQAQWSARLANSMALRLKSLKGEGRQELADLIGSEESRIRFFQNEIEKL